MLESNNNPNDNHIVNSDKEYNFLMICMDLFMLIDEYCLKSLTIDQIKNFIEIVREEMNDIEMPNNDRIEQILEEQMTDGHIHYKKFV